MLGLPRGGVPVAFEVATAIHAPLDVFVVRKLGAPNHEELAFGAIASGGVTVFNKEIIEAVGISEKQINATVAREQIELWLAANAHTGRIHRRVAAERR